MSNAASIAIPWLAFAVHLTVALLVGRRVVDLPLVPLVNLATAGCVLAYWAQRWYGYLFRGVTWYASDQLLPLYAVLVCVLAGLALAGRTSGTAPNWIAFGVDAVALLGFAIFASTFRINRLF